MAEPNNQQPAVATAGTTTSPGPDSLLSRIKTNLQAVAAPPAGAGSVLGQGQAVGQVSQAATGKLGQAVAGPTRSRQAELAVTDTVQQAQRTLTEKSQMQAMAQTQKMEAIQADEQFKQTLMSEEQLGAREKLLNIKRDILTQYTNNSRQLDVAKDKAKLEQLGFAARLSNDKYLNDLQKQAKIANLGDELAFQEELMRSAFAEEESMFRDNMEFRSLIQADEREFREQLSSISLEFAQEMANRANEAARKQAAWSGIGSIVSAALGKTAQMKWDSATGGWNSYMLASGQQAASTKFEDTGTFDSGPFRIKPPPMTTPDGTFYQSGEYLDAADRAMGR